MKQAKNNKPNKIQVALGISLSEAKHTCTLSQC